MSGRMLIALSSMMLVTPLARAADQAFPPITISNQLTTPPDDCRARADGLAGDIRRAARSGSYFIEEAEDHLRLALGASSRGDLWACRAYLEFGEMLLIDETRR
jgi:hypothetical protein